MEKGYIFYHEAVGDTNTGPFAKPLLPSLDYSPPANHNIKKDSAVAKKHDSTSTIVKRHRDTLKSPVVKTQQYQRFLLPDTIKIEYVKPGFKLKRLKQDSLTKSQVAQEDTTHYVGFYNKHHLRVIHTNPVQIHRENGDWIFYVLLLLTIAVTLIRVIHFRNIKQVKDAFMSSTISNQIVRDESILFQRASVFLTVVFYLVAALFLYKLSIIYHITLPYLPDGFGRFLIFVLLISMAYSLKLIFLRLIGYIFQVDKAITGYIFSVFLINNVVGMVLIPILICIFFLPPDYMVYFLDFSIIMVVAAFIYRIFRGVAIGLSFPTFSLYYLFLYLCSLEIAPLLFIIKLLKR